MGFFSADLESMVELYQREAAELIEEFNARQAKAIQENVFSADGINAIFRVVHTIKSSAAMMGLSEISNCTHQMEELFLLFRDKPERTLGYEDRIFDVMDQFSDYMENENNRVMQEDFKPRSAGALLAAIQSEIGFFREKANHIENETPDDRSRQPDVIPLVQKAEDTKEADAAQGDDELIWQVTLTPDCQMENVRAYMLVRDLSELCSSIITEPSNLELPAAADEIARKGLLLRLQTARQDEAARRLSSSPYVAQVVDVNQETGQSGVYAGEKTVQKAAEEDEISAQKKFSMVSWDHVMHLQNITGELITANTILNASLKDFAKNGELANEMQTMKRLFQELEKLVAAVSMMPVSSAMPQYYRLVRDVAAKEGKRIRLKVVGQEIEVDRNLLDTLSNPLVHLLRNAADHGIELPEVRRAAGKDPDGNILLKFENLTDHLRVTVQDDGGGMDRDRLLKKAQEQGILFKDADEYSTKEILELALLPGLSTSEQVNQYSGRGVGMDAVQDVVSSLGGSLSMDSEPGKGSSIVMEVPVSVTSAECIRFMVGSYTCLIPVRFVVRIYNYDEVERNLLAIDGRWWFQAEEMLPVLDLFSLYALETEKKDVRLIVIRDTEGAIALLSGPVTGQQTAVEKRLPEIIGRNFRARTAIIGCTVTETGGLGMMLNADWLIRLCGKDGSEDGN
jgi:two-component system chemotaxis sensor kinase CheA